MLICWKENGQKLIFFSFCHFGVEEKKTVWNFAKNQQNHIKSNKLIKYACEEKVKSTSAPNVKLQEEIA